MKSFAALGLLAFAACAGSADGVVTPDAGGNSDSGTMCDNAILWSPLEPEANAIVPVRVRVDVIGTPGVTTFTWRVEHDNATVPHTMESSSGDEIGFIADDPGVYYLSVTITGAATSCPFASATMNVKDPNANTDIYRVRTVPPSNSGAPPQEQLIQVNGGGDFDRAITLDPGVDATGVVRNNVGTGIAAYVKFMPQSTPNAFTELFVPASGAYDTKLVGVTHDVLVIPDSTALAPKLLTWTPQTTQLVVGPGTLVSGTVRNPANAALAGAKVQLTANGVPSTIATTAADGSFSLRADFPAGAMITAKVTPPAASGLPRLEATGAFTLTSSMQIAYSASLQTCDLNNTAVQRSGPLPGSKVTVVGSLAAIGGTVTAGVAANALGTVRVAASADGSGQLPTMLVPRAPSLSAVVQVGAADFSVVALDTSACSVGPIVAPAQINATGTTRRDATTALGGVVVEATPIGVLAQANAHTVFTTSDASGFFSLALASGGLYDVRFIDPHKRVARRDDLNVDAAGVPSSAILPAAIRMKGKVSISGIGQPLPLSSIQLLCAVCSGADASRPIAATATNAQSDYELAVPDPGTL